MRERGNPHYLRSLAHLNLGRIDEATADALKAAVLEPNSPKFQNHDVPFCEVFVKVVVSPADWLVKLAEAVGFTVIVVEVVFEPAPFETISVAVWVPGVE